MLFLIRCALGYDMGPGARPVILPVTAPRNRAREYLSKPVNHFLSSALNFAFAEFPFFYKHTHKGMSRYPLVTMPFKNVKIALPTLSINIFAKF